MVQLFHVFHHLEIGLVLLLFLMLLRENKSPARSQPLTKCDYKVALLLAFEAARPLRLNFADCISA